MAQNSFEHLKCQKNLGGLTAPPQTPSWVTRLALRASVGDPQFSDFFLSVDMSVVYNPLSNWYPCKVNFNDHEFDSSEQAYQWAKADYCKHACISIFSKIRVNKSVKTVRRNKFAKNGKLHIFATTNSILNKSLLLDMHHRITSKYIKYLQISQVA